MVRCLWAGRAAMVTLGWKMESGKMEKPPELPYMRGTARDQAQATGKSRPRARAPRREERGVMMPVVGEEK